MRKKTVSILTTSHFEADGNRCIYGGAERYGIELTRLFLELGWEVNWWQAGLNWTRQMLPGVTVHGIPAQESFAQTCSSLNRAFNEQAGTVDLAIYFVTFLAYPTVLPKSVSISHGIFWDYPTWENRIGGGELKEEWLHRMEKALYAPTRVVSVDTATINWASWQWPALLNRFTYIPNFVDTAFFQPVGDEDKNDDKIRILFPRRLTTVRGIGEAMKAATLLTERYPQVEFHFVGRGHNFQHEKMMLNWAAENENIYYYWRTPDGMKEIYQNMDICLIPSKSTEGTSLSCLEAMACGLPVIAGNIGGLPDLIIHQYNGLLISPTADQLIEALVYLIENKEVRLELGQKARETSLNFDLVQWKKSWKKLINEVMSPERSEVKCHG
ncbi:glycosyltransferase family 4 protein [Candidatus Contubernalis alkaliaceticus]|uniref:glycosyltransferase family 4 protein n=1 Tax=Candidatus Contubernalis alkaliaceticus TaxID=338645 RepID=UPI001F4C13F3|nr:glycosyltransferase family 4 protein [Candidatus Contubernalis alkalaceticus]UNC91154.1 glycosyltransferase family 4 protein [Candidatus Contubernalis alkalaceticus]